MLKFQQTDLLQPNNLQFSSRINLINNPLPQYEKDNITYILNSTDFL